MLKGLQLPSNWYVSLQGDGHHGQIFIKLVITVEGKKALYEGLNAF